MTITRHIYRTRIADGVCGRCGLNPPKPGRNNCQGCIDYARDYNRRRYNRRPGRLARFQETGVARTNAEFCQERRDLRRARGVCTACGKNKVHKFATCAKCRKHNVEYRKARRAAGHVRRRVTA